MPLVASSVDSPVPAEIVCRLVEVYRPERIHLFGSAARGEATVHSDYDLLVVVPDDTPTEMRRGVRAYETFEGIKASTDVMVWTRTAFDGRLQLRASLPSTVVGEGRPRYAA